MRAQVRDADWAALYSGCSSWCPPRCCSFAHLHFHCLQVRDADWTAMIGALFRSSKHDSAIFALALPAVLALAADPLLSMVDTIFVGQVGTAAPAAMRSACCLRCCRRRCRAAAPLLPPATPCCCPPVAPAPTACTAPVSAPAPVQAGTDALAALGVNSALFTLAFVVFNFLATATTPMVAASLATGDKERAGKVTLQASC